jgi:PAS domain S-box-containing protein
MAKKPDSNEENQEKELNDAANEFETTSDLILITDAYGLFLRVSPSSRDLLGYEPEEIEGRLAPSFIHPTDLAETREEMRASRQSGRARHFYCRYVHKDGYPVELMWSGLWLEDKGQYVFVGRLPPRRVRLPFAHRLDVLDGFQISKGLFALSLVLAWAFDLGNSSTFEIRHLIEHFSGNTTNWIVFMSCYVVASLACLSWKQRLFQFVVSMVSVVIWIWMGFVTMAAPSYVAAAGIYEIMLGVGSICVLYLRGRQL